MEIKYLQSMQQNPVLWGDESRGITLERIKELEQKLNNGKEFPKAFREYLFLGGDYNHLGFDSHGIGYDYKNMTTTKGEDFIALKEYYEKKMPKYKVSLNRPYIILDSYDGLSFMFIYLDEGDDPRVYNFGVDPDYRDDNGEIIYPIPEKTFSELINRLVDYALRGLQPW